jgi:hypothetical protein
MTRAGARLCVGEWVQSQNLLILTPPAGVF